MTGALVLAEPESGGVLPVKLGSVFDSVKDLKNRLTGIHDRKPGSIFYVE